MTNSDISIESLLDAIGQETYLKRRKECLNLR